MVTRQTPSRGGVQCFVVGDVCRKRSDDPVSLGESPIADLAVFSQAKLTCFSFLLAALLGSSLELQFVPIALVLQIPI